MTIVRILLLLILTVCAAPAWAATVEEMHNVDKLMVEADTVTGNLTLITKPSATSPFLSGCIATAVAPNYVEASSNISSCDLTANLRVAVEKFNILLSCEDQTNTICMVGGGPVRTTTFSSVTSATTSSVTTVYTGPKTFTAQIINATSETKAATVTIYGNLISSTTGGIPICTITLPSTATTLQLQDSCYVDARVAYPYYFYTASVYTSASSAPLTVYASN